MTPNFTCLLAGASVAWYGSFAADGLPSITHPAYLTLQTSTTWPATSTFTTWQQWFYFPQLMLFKSIPLLNSHLPPPKMYNRLYEMTHNRDWHWMNVMMEATIFKATQDHSMEVAELINEQSTLTPTDSHWYERNNTHMIVHDIC